MKIIYKVGNLLKATEPVIAHGVNCQGKYGAGTALAIRKKYPLAYSNYLQQLELYNRINRLPLGTVSLSTQPDMKIIANCFTQEFYGFEKKQYVSYKAIANCISVLDNFCKNSQLDDDLAELFVKAFNHPITSVAFPKIGCSLGGGDWNIVSQIIEENSVHFQPVVYVLNESEIPKYTDDEISAGKIQTP